MRNNKVKHTKVRNTGLLYEFLLRQITLDVLKGGNKPSKAVQMIKNRFNENTELGKELALYNVILLALIFQPLGRRCSDALCFEDQLM